ncbi:MAG: NAD(P)H-dependent glycerol-3-phosphate dehydrogenase [Candidatus Cloacimonadales bacterium]|jgi:glycerol-3-phosphate dehydrogenase (NAD(P)+)|nr:NAD(P)-dependent glycerol-3-phosphate dehydrogenase [Candidatus Cloacimonadota bacterium]MDD3501508.1 NAD(P)-dependent glycerol-3-phosphate dehydrogenase [Candidatus Cloacimonadota bacterium]MDX9976459.1 NAD(P)H-dependent glycerol-3-phosphate dehydrogenase [Candidatus Cloacimonadales bacterium]
MSNIVIIGGGSWGLAMAQLLSIQHNIKVWEYNLEFVKELQKTKTNTKLLPDLILNDSIFFSNDKTEIFADKSIDMIIIATPVSFIRNTIKSFIEHIKECKNLKAIVNLAKGLEQNSHKRVSEILKDELPTKYHHIICTLSGPSHAEEVSRNIPTTVVIAGDDLNAVHYARDKISSPYFRVYSSNDLIGVELGGTIKNIIAIAAGIIDGLQLGDNTKGALLTRGIAEIIRLGVALGAKTETFSGLSGIGDLITTAISTHSRNRHVGFELGKGRKLDDILNSMTMVAEGVYSSKAIWELKEQLNVEMPIVDEVYQVLFFNKPSFQALNDLMTRELKDEV